MPRRSPRDERFLGVARLGKSHSSPELAGGNPHLYFASNFEPDPASDAAMPMRFLSAMRASGVYDFSQILKSKYKGYRKFIKCTDNAERRSAGGVSREYPVSTSNLPMLDSTSRSCWGVNMRRKRPMVAASVSLSSPRNEELGLCTDPSATC